MRSTGSGFESQRYLVKWLVLSTCIGIVAGLGSVLFYAAIRWFTAFFLGRIVGYMPPSPAGEGTSTAIVAMMRPWALPIVTTAGGLISGLIVFGLAPEAEGHGTDTAIEAIHKKRGIIRARIPAVKLLASAITIGSGGSGGREGPAALISAGFGSLLGKWLRLDAQNRRIAVAAGIGAGIGAIFRAPLGGALLSAEILYIHDLEAEALIPGLIASIIGYTIFSSFFGYKPIFSARPGGGFDNPIQLVCYAALGVACGLVGILYARSFYGIADLFHRLPLPAWSKPGIGGLLVGLMGMGLPACLHTGYGWIQIVMGPDSNILPLWFVLILPFAKILSTSLSIGSGGSGGIFGPGMVIGGMLGESFWRLFHTVLPGMPSNSTGFVLIGMMGMFGGIAHAPFAVMLMVAEMTGNLTLLAPAMVVVALSTAIVGENTIYRSQVADRASSPAHRVRFSFPLLSSMVVRDAITPCERIVPGDVPVSAVAPFFNRDLAFKLVVRDHDGKFAGVLTRAHLDRIPLHARETTTVREAMATDVLVLDPEDHLDEALERLTGRGLSWTPVVENERVLGKLSVKDSLASYRKTLESSVRRTNLLPPDAILFEAGLGNTSPLAGKTLRELPFPTGTLVVSIIRQGETIFPQADTRLESGDLIIVLGDAATQDQLRTFVGDAVKPSPGDAAV